MLRLRSVIWLALMSLALHGCERGELTPTPAYLERLARVLETPLAASTTQPLGAPAFPPPAVLRQPFAVADLNWLEFARLHRCDFGDLVGYRNSGLGRVMDDYERLRYELRLRTALNRCLAGVPTAPAPATAELLKRLLEQKARDVTIAYGRLAFASDDFSRWLRLPAAAASLKPASQAKPMPLSVLQTLAAQSQRLKDGEADVLLERQVLDAALGKLSASGGGGTALAHWVWVEQQLQTAVTLLGDAGTRICRNGQPTPRARRLKRVFQRYYVGELQPELARRVNPHRPWVESLDQWLKRSGYDNSELEAWRRAAVAVDHPGSLWSRTRQAFKDHATAWQQLAQACDLDLFAA